MNKLALVKAVALSAEISQDKADRAVTAFIKVLTKSILDNGSQKIDSFAVFKVLNIAARQGRNPRTGATIAIPARNRVVWYPHNSVKAAVN